MPPVLHGHIGIFRRPLAASGSRGEAKKKRGRHEEQKIVVPGIERHGTKDRSLFKTAALADHFSTRKLPRKRASIPELKKVRIASVGVWTMASPRRLKEVFMMTGTPVRLPNSSMRR